MLGRSLISLTSTSFWRLRASFFFFCSSYLNLPKSRILHTGGSAPGAVSTQSTAAFTGMGSAFVAPAPPDHIAALGDEADAHRADLLVDAGPLAGGGDVHRWSGYVGSPLSG